MLSISPSSFPTHSEWLLENNPLNHNQIYVWTDSADIASEPLIQFSSHVKLESCSDDAAIAKKLKHNASERDRRKKMNCLYSSLRLMLPAADRTKRISNPATITRALRYIPELQQQVEVLKRRKQGLVTRSKIAAQPQHHQDAISIHEEKQTENETRRWSSSSSVSASWLNQTEVLLHFTSHKLPFSQTLLSLEDDGLLLLTASSFQSHLDGNLFFTLHLKVKANPSRLLQEILKEKL